MKKIFHMVVILLVIVSIGLAQEKKYVVGLDASVLVGKVKTLNGGVKSTIGISPLLGIGYKSYFKPLKQDAYSIYWDIGTDILVMPFIGIGADYRLKVGDLPLYVGANISSRLTTFLLPIPSLSVGLYF